MEGEARWQSGFPGWSQWSPAGRAGSANRAAKALAAQGAKVYVIARSRERLAATVDEMQRAGGDAHSLPVDVTSEEQLVHAASVIESDAGKVDILIAGAGIMDLGPVETMPSETFEAMMRVNYLGVVHTVRAFLPLVNKGGQGRIAILSSLAAKISPPYFAAYSASKAAVTGFAHALRQELLHQGTRVVLIHPGPTATPLVDGYIGGEYYPVPPGVPVVSPELVAKVVLRAIEHGRARSVCTPQADGDRMAGRPFTCFGRPDLSPAWPRQRARPTSIALRIALNPDNSVPGVRQVISNSITWMGDHGTWQRRTLSMLYSRHSLSHGVVYAG